MESQGVLRDMWNALQYLNESEPDFIQSVEWFTFEHGFSRDPEPMMIALTPFDTEESPEIDNNIKKWLYYDISTQTPRGVLVARVTVRDTQIFIVETQRRMYRKKKKDDNFENTEQSLAGFVFVLNDKTKLEPFLRILLSKIRTSKGVVKKLVSDCPGKAAAFSHSKAMFDLPPIL